jgi:hypothetical protein
MSVRIHKKSRFTTVSNDIVNNSSVSWEARGLLVYLLSKPEGWIVRNSDLIRQSPAGRDKVAAILKELENKYIFRWETRNPEGRIEWKSESLNRQKTSTNGFQPTPILSTATAKP